MASPKTMIFCDFDGTITTEETFVGSLTAISRKEDLLEWFGKFRRKEITLRTCTETLFSLVPSSRYQEIADYAATVQVRPGFSEFLDAAAEKGFPVVVISGGIRRMQEEILRPYRDRIQAFYSCELDTSGPYMRFYSEYASGEENMSKERIMGLYDYERAICVGDQVTDIHMAEHSDIVFARDSLAEHLRLQQRDFYPWETFGDVTAVLNTL